MLNPKRNCPTREDLCNIENDIKRWQGYLKCCAELRQGVTLEEAVRKGEAELRRAVARSEKALKSLSQLTVPHIHD